MTQIPRVLSLCRRQVLIPSKQLISLQARHNYIYRSMMTTPSADRYKLIFFVPHPSLEACKEAVFATGAGTFPGGKYSKACFQSPGIGQFLPGEGANPNIGAVGTVESVEEMKVEILCVGRKTMLDAVQALLKAHPYEEPAYEVYKLENV
ncbi:hypothetical protein DTO169C6_4584 [Paecilomyces variotii]|nr:hypothetical protein DTO169C6_4584 [Paecilomyces variotii]